MLSFLDRVRVGWQLNRANAAFHEGDRTMARWSGADKSDERNTRLTNSAKAAERAAERLEKALAIGRDAGLSAEDIRGIEGAHEHATGGGERLRQMIAGAASLDVDGGGFIGGIKSLRPIIAHVGADPGKDRRLVERLATGTTAAIDDAVAGLETLGTAGIDRRKVLAHAGERVDEAQGMALRLGRREYHGLPVNHTTVDNPLHDATMKLMHSWGAMAGAAIDASVTPLDVPDVTSRLLGAKEDIDAWVAPIRPPVAAPEAEDLPKSTAPVEDAPKPQAPVDDAPKPQAVARR